VIPILEDCKDKAKEGGSGVSKIGTNLAMLPRSEISVKRNNEKKFANESPLSRLSVVVVLDYTTHHLVT